MGEGWGEGEDLAQPAPSPLPSPARERGATSTMPTVTAHLDPLIATLPAEAQQFVVAALPEARSV